MVLLSYVLPLKDPQGGGWFYDCHWLKMNTDPPAKWLFRKTFLKIGPQVFISLRNKGLGLAANTRAQLLDTLLNLFSAGWFLFFLPFKWLPLKNIMPYYQLLKNNFHYQITWFLKIDFLFFFFFHKEGLRTCLWTQSMFIGWMCS